MGRRVAGRDSGRVYRHPRRRTHHRFHRRPPRRSPLDDPERKRMKSNWRHWTVACGAIVAIASAYAADAPYDLVLRNARVVDGTGNPWYRADIAIRDDVIA